MGLVPPAPFFHIFSFFFQNLSQQVQSTKANHLPTSYIHTLFLSVLTEKVEVFIACLYSAVLPFRPLELNSKSAHSDVTCACGSPAESLFLHDSCKISERDVIYQEKTLTHVCVCVWISRSFERIVCFYVGNTVYFYCSLSWALMWLHRL